MLVALVALSLGAAGCGGDTPASTTASPTTASTQAPTTASTAPATTGTSTVDPSGYVTVDVQETRNALQTDDDAQIVDVREPSEWAATGVVPGALLIPLGELEQKAPSRLARDRQVYVICNSGNRSRTASEILIKLDYRQVFNVAGGIQAWLEAGFPVLPYRP